MNNMAQMNPMAGVPTGGPVGMMPAGAGPMMMGNTQNGQGHRSILNTCIYEYLIKEGMYDSARALLNAPDSEVKTRAANEPNANGVNDDAMDTDSKDDVDSKRPADLPPPSNVATNFLYEWFTLFWDMQAAATRRTQVQNPAVGQYFQHTQHQNRLRQTQQQELLRSMRSEGGMFNPQNPMMRSMPNGMPIAQNKNNLARTAMANNTNPQAMQMLQKQGQMQQNAADMDANRRPGSPGAAENAPSPNKRPRLDGNGAPFNGQQPGMMPNGQRPPGAMPGQQVQPGQQANNAAQAQQLLLTNGINPNNLTPQQFQQFQNQPPHAQVKSIQAYSQNLQQHHGQQMPNKQAPNPNAPQGQGSPGMMPGQGPDGANLNAYYHPGEMNPGPMRPGAPGQVGGAGGSNHALQDYQMQLMLLEQQNKKRLMMARQEQDSMGNMPRADGQPGPAGAQGANGQPFQDTSPQAARSGASPNPSEQMKRGTPQMGAAGIPSPLPEGANSRGSPNPMGFMQNNLDPNMNSQFFKIGNGMEHNGMGNVQMNGGMRPPSSHPGQPGFQGQMTPQMAAAAARQQGAQGGPGGMQWQGQPNGNGMPQQGQQGPPQGTPQQRAMPPPPSAPANGAAANANTSGRTTASPQQGNAAPPTPQQSNKAAPKKKDTKNAKTKAAAAKKNANTGATPASESQDQEPPTPATPITPAANANFPKGVQQPPASTAASAGAPAAPVAAPQPDPSQVGSFDPGMEFPMNMDFANPTITTDVLQDFDFDSFLHDDADGANFGFDPSAFGMEGAGEIGAD